jgi:ATP/maltotriose-dependent transcriptional regulator MalT
MTADGSVWLGELRRRQGRLDEAQQLFDDTEGHPMSTVGRAALALDRGDAVSAGDLAERYLRGLNAHNRTERVTALEIVVRARAAAGRVDEARAAADELEVIAREAGTVPLRGTARVCHGLLASIGGDLDDARRAYEDAVDHFHRSGATYEGARARVELASVLGQAGRVDAAVQELRRAIEQFTPMAAQPDMARAERQLASMLEPQRVGAAAATAVATATASTVAAVTVLSPRECDVLRLVAKGLSNQRVAEQLFISEHTVHRHVANILTKLDVPSRSAAVAQAARLGLLES